jgi:hypothetical protein
MNLVDTLTVDAIPESRRKRGVLSTGGWGQSVAQDQRLVRPCSQYPARNRETRLAAPQRFAPTVGTCRTACVAGSTVSACIPMCRDLVQITGTSGAQEPRKTSDPTRKPFRRAACLGAPETPCRATCRRAILPARDRQEPCWMAVALNIARCRRRRLAAQQRVLPDSKGAAGASRASCVILERFQRTVNEDKPELGDRGQVAAEPIHAYPRDSQARDESGGESDRVPPTTEWQKAFKQFHLTAEMEIAERATWRTWRCHRSAGVLRPEADRTEKTRAWRHDCKSLFVVLEDPTYED